MLGNDPDVRSMWLKVACCFYDMEFNFLLQ